MSQPTKRKRRQRRFTKPYEIDAAIIKLRRKIVKYEVVIHDSMKGLENAMDLLHAQNLTPKEVGSPNYKVTFLKGRIAKLEKSIKDINSNRIPRLVKTRAALLTTPMSFIANDGVILQ